ncbi:hypothetical protein, partial [Pseudomonas sp. GM55]|uniref:hypothetical protein n=1 Tax=Pseudomonas sp. GM55 TaxID=1144333 RepID=UPI001EE66A47
MAATIRIATRPETFRALLHAIKKVLHGIPGNTDNEVSVGAAAGCDLLDLDLQQYPDRKSKIKRS